MNTGSWIIDGLPDSDITVLMRLSDPELPIWPGFHDGETWYSVDGATIKGPVTGWMELEEASEAIDQIAMLRSLTTEAAGSTLTSQGKRYGFTTAGALAHLGEMLSHDEDWDTLTNYDRACIREVATCAERHLSNNQVTHGEAVGSTDC